MSGEEPKIVGPREAGLTVQLDALRRRMNAERQQEQPDMDALFAALNHARGAPARLMAERREADTDLDIISARIRRQSEAELPGIRKMFSLIGRLMGENTARVDRPKPPRPLRPARRLCRGNVRPKS